jgi:hypothetical protein
MPTPALEIKRLKVAALLLTLWLCGCGVIVTPSVSTTLPPPTPTPSLSTTFVMQSLFAGDTCAPPCWFGLTAGVSTSEDARTFFATRSDIVMGPNWGPGAFGPGTAVFEGNETDGHYAFQLQGEWERPDGGFSDYSQIQIRDGYVYSIWIWIKDYITLQETISLLGSPELIRAAAIDDIALLNFIYPEALISIRLKANLDECNISDLGQNFWVSEIRYYSSSAAVEPTERILIDQLQPILYSYGMYERNVSSVAWRRWHNEDAHISCEEAIEQLPEEVIYPTVMPSLLITPTATP